MLLNIIQKEMAMNLQIGLPLYLNKKKIAGVMIDKTLFSKLRPILALMRYRNDADEYS